jgi:hypothetical protein
MERIADAIHAPVKGSEFPFKLHRLRNNVHAQLRRTIEPWDTRE